MSISFVNTKKIDFFSKPYIVAGEEASVDLITFLLVHDVLFCLLQKMSQTRRKK